jgi:hypothetical protein
LTLEVALGFLVPGDLVEGVTIIEKVDEVTGLSRKIVIESRAADLRPCISIIDPETGESVKLLCIDLDARSMRQAEARARRVLPTSGSQTATPGLAPRPQFHFVYKVNAFCAGMRGETEGYLRVEPEAPT